MLCMNYNLQKYKKLLKYIYFKEAHKKNGEL